MSQASHGHRAGGLGSWTMQDDKRLPRWCAAWYVWRHTVSAKPSCHQQQEAPAYLQANRDSPTNCRSSTCWYALSAGMAASCWASWTSNVSCTGRALRTCIPFMLTCVAWAAAVDCTLGACSSCRNYPQPCRAVDTAEVGAPAAAPTSLQKRLQVRARARHVFREALRMTCCAKLSSRNCAAELALGGMLQPQLAQKQALRPSLLVATCAKHVHPAASCCASDCAGGWTQAGACSACTSTRSAAGINRPCPMEANASCLFMVHHDHKEDQCHRGTNRAPGWPHETPIKQVWTLQFSFNVRIPGAYMYRQTSIPWHTVADQQQLQEQHLH